MNTHAPTDARDQNAVILDSLVMRCQRALTVAQRLGDACIAAVAGMINVDGGSDANALTRHQAALHGCAWFSVYVEALRQMLDWATRLDAVGKRHELESLLFQAAFGEYLAQLRGGVNMSQGEVFRVDMLIGDTARARRDGATDPLARAFSEFVDDTDVRTLAAHGFVPPVRARIAALLAQGLASRQFGDPAYDDDTLTEVREQFARYADEHAAAAHQWHLRDELIPDGVIRELGALGVFGLTVPAEYGGSAMGKSAMCVVTEELSRGFIGLGSLGTRSEIAAELIGGNGTDAQKRTLLPGIASGEIIPAAAFTEPDVGSDLASIKARAERDGDIYRVFGNKTWTTHGARSDLLTLMVRTDRNQPGFRGLSMLLATKPRGTDREPFPARGMSGSEIHVLGYGGMKEYEIAFDGFEVPASALLGGVEGRGFKQLMTTFESARIQTAARAVGVAQCAMDLALGYAGARIQFGQLIIAFPRVADKLAWMGVETMIARQMCLFAARRKDAGHRCDLEAGMAKLLAARVAWTNADNALQVHGGNGYAKEFVISRVLCDARILSVFEGAAEIQAQVIGRALIA